MNGKEITINSIGLGEALISSEVLKNISKLILVLIKTNGEKNEYTIEKCDLPNELSKIFNNKEISSFKSIEIDFIEENIKKHFTEININK